MVDVGTDAIQTFFFKAMLEGYAAGGSKKLPVVGMPGYKEVRLSDGNFLLVDCWCTNSDTQKSAGTTTIWVDMVPVWVMHYGGFYDKSVTPFLKRALYKNYKTQKFFGGRGPLTYDERPITYVNQPRFEKFDKFEGREEVFDSVRLITLGFHEYWGMSLL